MAKAFINLLNIYTYKEITITQITLEADVSRKTFYTNFKSKDELLKYYITQLANNFTSRLHVIEENKISNLTYSFFEFWLEYTFFLESIYKNRLFHEVIPLFELHLRKIILEYEILPLTNIYISSYHSAGICKMLEIWVESGFKDDVAEISKYFLQAQNIDV